MASIPIHNETDYILTDAMQEEIIRDAHDYFGEEVHSIRVQVGLERHALNTRTREIRYAFFPQDFGMGGGLPITPTPPARSAAKPAPAKEAAAAEDEDFAPRGILLAHFGTAQDDGEEDDRFKMDSQNEDDEDDEEDDEEEEYEEYEEDDENA
jgi:hypothetical protein